MSRSCHSAVFSSAVTRCPRTTRARPHDALGEDRVSLVRHRRAPLLLLAERLERLAHLAPLQVANLGRDPLQRTRPPSPAPTCSPRDGRARRPASRPGRPGARGARRRAPRPVGRAWRACRPRPLTCPTAASSAARSRRSSARSSSATQPATLKPNVIGSAHDAVRAARHQRAAVARSPARPAASRTAARSPAMIRGRLDELHRHGGVVEVLAGHPQVHVPRLGLADRFVRAR